MFDKLIIKSIIMFGILVFVILGCSNMMHKTGNPPVVYKFLAPKIVYQSIHDTLYKAKTIQIDEVKFRARIERLLDKSESAIGDISEIKKLNIDIQKQNVILFNRWLQRRTENDSLKMMVQTIRDTLTYANQRAYQFYSKAKISDKAQRENKTINQNINWQFWIAFFSCIMLLGGNLFLTDKINKRLKKSNIYA